ncbi:hypothetical protein [Shewanella waksmanii]|uniref:hypothetical protein n=1 Tax=Shewanella waksmanii TaxID=213783 RepID=UPI0037361D1C
MVKLSRTMMGLLLLGGLSGCNIASHGSFIASSNINSSNEESLTVLGEVTGESCQTSILYVLPSGEQVATKEAITNAFEQIPNTLQLADISIDDQLKIGVGYSVQCIIVSATALGYP